jgi:hypothetical protein
MSYLGCSVRLYLQLFVGRAHVLFTFGSSLPPVVCRRAHVLFRVFGSSLPPVVCREGSCLIYIICCLCIVVSNIYWFVLLFCFPVSCVPYIASFSGLSIFDCPFDIL